MPLLQILGILVLGTIALFTLLYVLTRRFVSRRILVALGGSLLFVLPTMAWLDWVFLKNGPRSTQNIIFLFIYFGLPALLVGAINALILRPAFVDSKNLLQPVKRRGVGTIIISFLIVLMAVLVVFFLGGVLASGDPAGIE